MQLASLGRGGSALRVDEPLQRVQLRRCDGGELRAGILPLHRLERDTRLDKVLEVSAERVEPMLKLVSAVLLQLPQAVLRRLRGARQRLAQGAEVGVESEVGGAQSMRLVDQGRALLCGRLLGHRAHHALYRRCHLRVLVGRPARLGLGLDRFHQKLRPRLQPVKLGRVSVHRRRYLGCRLSRRLASQPHLGDELAARRLDGDGVGVECLVLLMLQRRGNRRVDGISHLSRSCGLHFGRAALAPLLHHHLDRLLDLGEQRVAHLAELCRALLGSCHEALLHRVERNLELGRLALVEREQLGRDALLCCAKRLSCRLSLRAQLLGQRL
mmetsp:Transcript_15479/g.50545  ORF Transcript_15479/g.50545 Transcript_15479/m.50545 type:complete len:327 (+) Transcript_15479:1749-2729(+)